jgi:predicted MFS family arabinose efflux permease
MSKKLLFLLAVCAGASVANLYYAQPMLALIAQSFGAATTVGIVTVATQVGYTVGILFILPMGDLMDRRRLVVVLAAVLALGMLACATASSLMGLAIASVFVGLGATITQSMIPMAADLVEEDQRVHAVGFVFSGLLTGILAARTLSGVVSELWGWRAMFAVACVAAVALAITLRSALPKFLPKVAMTYPQLLGSLVMLLRQYPQLRVACAIQACVFAVFSAFWSNLALLLAAPPFNMGAAIAGAFGLVGIVGVSAASLSGKLSRRHGPRLGLRIGLVCCLAAFGVLALAPSLVGIVVGVVLLDFGMSLTNVANQASILGLDGAARSRINTVYVTAIFLGGAIGSAVSAVAWAHAGWLAVCVFGLGVMLLACGMHVMQGMKKLSTAKHA